MRLLQEEKFIEKNFFLIIFKDFYGLIDK